MTRNYPETGVRALSHWIFNAYVVEDGGEGAPFVVDAGIPLNGRASYEELTRRMGKRPEELALITATHAHSDHVAGAPYLHRKTKAPVHLHEKVRDYLGGERGVLPAPRQLLWYRNLISEQPFHFGAAREAVATGTKEGFGGDPRFKLSCPIGGFLTDGARLPGASDWQVLHTPGHSECSVCFWNEKTRTLFSGDTVLTVQGRAWFNPVHNNAAKMKQTEERLRMLPVEHLFPGHGNPIRGEGVLQSAWSHEETVGDARPATCALKNALQHLRHQTSG